MSVKSGEMRQTLLRAIEEVRLGRLDAQQATAMAKLAAQVSLSLQVEANMRAAQLAAKEDFGEMEIGSASTMQALPPTSLVHRISDTAPKAKNSVFDTDHED